MIYFPEYLQIETLAGKCSANCVMCNIKESPRKGVMSVKDFIRILEAFEPYVDRLKYLNLQGLGETLLDPTIITKVREAKARGFKGVGFATNATHVDARMAHHLMAAGLDTIIFSVDGFKESHEKIRKVDYGKVMENIVRFINLRNSCGNTKIIMRMIRQDINREEWPEYSEIWRGVLSKKFGDQVACYDVWGTEVEEKRQERLNRIAAFGETKQICPDLLNRMLLFINGDVILCCGDMRVRGNVFKTDPMKIYNNFKFQRFRNMMLEGRITDIGCCKNCQVLLSSMDKIYLDARGG